MFLYFPEDMLQASNLTRDELLRLDKGECGLAPEDMVPGEFICIPQGYTIPVVLHPENDHYILLGEACQTFLMCGEAVQAIDAGDGEF